MNLYSYNGPVLSFGKCIADNWKASTQAVSMKKARNNLVYQFKKEHKYSVRYSNITLPGKIVIIE